MEPTRNNHQDDRLNKIELHVFNMNRELGEVIKIVKAHDKLLWIIVAGVVALLFKTYIS